MVRLLVFRRFVLALLFAAVLAVTARAAPASAQPNYPETKEVYLYDVPVGDGFIISVPFTWLRYRSEAYATPAEAEAALVPYYAAVAMGRQSYTSPVPFIALRPELVNEEFVEVVVPLLMPLENLGIASADDSTAEQIAQGLSVATEPRIIEINGRSAVVAFRDAALNGGSEIFYVFPEEGMVASVTFAPPACCPAYVPPQLEFLLSVIAVSFRREGEPFDGDAWSIFTETSEGYPREFIFEGVFEDSPPETTRAAATPTTAATAIPEATETPLPPSTTPAPTEASAVTSTPAAPTIPPTAEATRPACIVRANTRINLRSGPGTSFEVVGRLVDGETAEVYGQAPSDDGVFWWQLMSGAWVRADIVIQNNNCGSIPVLEGN